MVNFIDKFDENGKRVSSVLPEGINNYLIDIDGTICDDIPNEEPERMLTAGEIEGAKEKINEWYDAGHVITFFTARTNEHKEYTLRWLKEHGFKYHDIIFNKPRGGNYVWIDDKEVKTVLIKGKFEIN